MFDKYDTGPSSKIDDRCNLSIFEFLAAIYKKNLKRTYVRTKQKKEKAKVWLLDSLDQLIEDRSVYKRLTLNHQ